MLLTDTNNNKTLIKNNYLNWAEVNLDKKLIYYPVPKAAHTSIRYALKCDSKLCMAHGVDTSKFLAITSVRNPWDRVLSLFYYIKLYQNIRRHMKGVRIIAEKLGLTISAEWPQFVDAIAKSSDDSRGYPRDRHYCSQYLLHPPSIDILLRFENLQRTIFHVLYTRTVCAYW